MFSATRAIKSRNTKVNLIGVLPPKNNIKYKATPELLASVLARYSRSNDGLDKIMSQVDHNNPDKSIDRIFKFIDYGHASIGGLTGGIPIAMDNISMWLAYKLFEISQMSDGQESSTRYITLNETGLPLAEEIGIPEDLISDWNSVMSRSFSAYDHSVNTLTELIKLEPNLAGAPTNANDLLIARLSKNYVLDRARYFIPLATRTNVALIQSARMWAQTLTHLSSMPQIEAQNIASQIRDELNKVSPRLIKYSFPEKSYIFQYVRELGYSCDVGVKLLSTDLQPDNPWLSVDDSSPLWSPYNQSISDSLQYRQNRYGHCGASIRRTRVYFGWENIAIAEMRDLNRHRTGYRNSPFTQTGIYIPSELNKEDHHNLLQDQKSLLKELMIRRSPSYVYGLLLGSQTSFEHSTHLDKFIYEAELRTGMGAHFRYAFHMKNVLEILYQQIPHIKEWIMEGTAEPE